MFIQLVNENYLNELCLLARNFQKKKKDQYFVLP
jgi:hypothetical protein